MNGVLTFNNATDLIRALGLADPDPAYTKAYQAAHIENANRNADAAFERVREHAQSIIARMRGEA